jgi:DNA-binding beta-propeller fold protein YncE
METTMIETLESRTLFDAESYLLIADFNRDSVRRYDGTMGAFVDTFVPKHSGGMNQPWGVLFGPHDHDLYVSTGEFGGPGQLKAVLRYDSASGAFIDEFSRGGDLKSPRGIIFGPDGDLYVADRNLPAREGRVARYDGTSGAYLGDFVPLASGGLDRCGSAAARMARSPHRAPPGVASASSPSRRTAPPA